MNRARGIDVSHHQPTVDWSAVRASGVSFAGIKATEGLTYVDPKLKTNREGSRAQGFKLGLYYHFARPGSAKAQAEHLFRAVGPLAPNERFVLDFEEGSPIITPARTLAWIEEFLTALRQPRAILYTSARVWKMFGNPDWSAAPYVDLWLPRYNSTEEPEIPKPWARLPEGETVTALVHGQWMDATVVACTEKKVTLTYDHNTVERDINDHLLWKRKRPAWTFWQWTDGKKPAHTTPGVGACDADYFWGTEDELTSYVEGSASASTS